MFFINLAFMALFVFVLGQVTKALDQPRSEQRTRWHTLTSSPTAEETNNFLVPNGTFFVELIAFAIIFCILAQVRHPADQQGDDGAPGRDPRRSSPRPRRPRQRRSEAEEEFKAQLADARKEAARIREEAREQGNAASSPRPRSRPRSRQQRVKDQAQAQIAAERQQALTSLRAEVGTLATSLAGRIVGESLEDDERSGRVVDRFLADLESLETSKSRSGTERRPDAARSLCRGAGRAGPAGHSDPDPRRRGDARHQAVRRRVRRTPRRGPAPGPDRRVGRGRGEGRGWPGRCSARHSPSRR